MIVIAIFVCLQLQITSVAAQSSEIILTKPVPVQMMAGHLDYFLEEGKSLSATELFGEKSSRFEALDKAIADFGYTQKTIWLRLTLVNNHPTAEVWRLYFHENFKQLFEVYAKVENESIETLLLQDLQTPFSTRPIAYPELVAPLNLKKGERAQILIRYRSQGSSNLAISIETQASFDHAAARNTAKSYLFVGMTMVLIVGALVASAIFRYWIFPAYIAYASVTLLFIMHADGIAFQLLWPNAPEFNSWASIPIGGGIPITGALFAMLFLQTSRFHPWVHKVLLGVMVVPILLIVWSFIGDEQWIKKTLVLVASLSLVICAGAGFIAARTRLKQVRFYILAWTVGAFSSLIMVSRHFWGFDISQDFQYDSMRAVIAFDAAMMGLAIADQYNQMRSSRQSALQESLAAANNTLHLNRRLAHLEEQYALAEELAQSRSEQLADTVHDLRQPLNALRLNVHSMISGSEISQNNSGQSKSIDAETIEATFTYLETLVSDHLKPKATAFYPSANVPKMEPEIKEAEDVVDVVSVLTSIHQMFGPDADAKGLDFEIDLNFEHMKSCENISPLDLMRVVSNLVANAIKYTAQGHVFLKGEEHNGSVVITICDTGDGLSETQFELAQERSERLSIGEDVEGSGLGLSIAREVAARNNWNLALDLEIAKKVGGTHVQLIIPSPA